MLQIWQGCSKKCCHDTWFRAITAINTWLHWLISVANVWNSEPFWNDWQVALSMFSATMGVKSYELAIQTQCDFNWIWSHLELFWEIERIIRRTNSFSFRGKRPGMKNQFKVYWRVNRIYRQKKLNIRRVSFWFTTHLNVLDGPLSITCFQNFKWWGLAFHFHGAVGRHHFMGKFSNGECAHF